MSINKTSDEKTFLDYMLQFQSGDFSNKKEFVDFFLNTSDRNIYVQGFRLFMAICNHDDMDLLTEFLSGCDEKQLEVFLAYVPQSLTVRALPLLLALYETWEETYVGQNIARIICEMLGEKYFEEKHYYLDELGDLFVRFSKENDLNLYYYNSQRYFAGDMTKKIITMAMYCRSQSKRFPGDQMSSIISNGTGTECPVYYDVEITDEVITSLFEYVSNIAELQQIAGNKYYFGHQII